MNIDVLLPVQPVNISRVLRAAAFNLAHHADPQSWMNANNINQEAEELFALLEARAVPYLLVGGLAMLTHVKGRHG